jgi:phospholipid/cholesterol/gamma-HCH transport system substrate-binding protein
MKQNHSKNAMLGIFVILGIAIFVIAVYFIGNTQNLFGKSTRITTVFSNVNGLQLGNNVRYAGVNVGTVKGIKILNDTAIAVDMFINEETIGLIKRNSVANISSDGLVGSMIVNIIPARDPSAEMVREGDTIRSITQKATADMLNTLNTTNENAALLTADLLVITSAITRGEGLVGELVMDKEMASDFKKSIANLETTSNSALMTITRLNNLLSQVNYEESVAGVLLSDRESAGQVEGIIDRFEEASQQIHRITTNLEEFTVNLKQGDGALDLVTQDVEFRNNLDTTLKNVEEASERFNENMEALKNNFLFRGYFRKQERELRRLERNN